MPLRLVAIRQLSLYLPISFGMKDEVGSSAQKPVPKDSGKGPNPTCVEGSCSPVHMLWGLRSGVRLPQMTQKKRWESGRGIHLWPGSLVWIQSRYIIHIVKESENPSRSYRPSSPCYIPRGYQGLRIFLSGLNKTMDGQGGSARKRTYRGAWRPEVSPGDPQSGRKRTTPTPLWPLTATVQCGTYPWPLPFI